MEIGGLGANQVNIDYSIFRESFCNDEIQVLQNFVRSSVTVGKGNRDPSTFILPTFNYTPTVAQPTVAKKSIVDYERWPKL